MECATQLADGSAGADEEVDATQPPDDAYPNPNPNRLFLTLANPNANPNWLMVAEVEELLGLTEPTWLSPWLLSAE